jgi:type II secretory pathway pseudopilin PulG
MTRRQNAGFTLLETMVSLVVLLAVGGIVMSGMTQLMRTQSGIANRTAMHTSVRSVTELLQQEIGQAGKVSLGGPTSLVTLTSAVAASAGGTTPVSFSLSATPTTPVPKVYPGEVLTIDVGTNQEAVTVLTWASGSGTAIFTNPHAASVPVNALGAFATGVVPPGTTCAGVACGSDPTHLKLYGDINGDGNMMYVEYTCVPGPTTAPGTLYRHQMPFDQTTAKTANDNTMILLDNVLFNPNDPNGNAVPCFAYQVQPLGSGTCVTNVAVTLTVQTQNKDLQTGQLQRETKALLNVAPRNVVEVYATASLVDPTRAQPTPTTVAALLP